jgi:TldD protein
MTIAADPRSFLYRDGLSPDAAQALTAAALGKADDGELYLQYRKSETGGSRPRATTLMPASACGRCRAR